MLALEHLKQPRVKSKHPRILISLIAHIKGTKHVAMHYDDIHCHIAMRSRAITCAPMCWSGNLKLTLHKVLQCTAEFILDCKHFFITLSHAHFTSSHVHFSL